MRMRRKQTLIFGFLFLIMAMSLGYALLTTTLNIEGIADIDSNTWSVYWDNLQVSSGSVEAEAPVLNSQKTMITYHVKLNEPGDFYEFTVDVKNDGTIDAMIETVYYDAINGSQIPTYLKYEKTYADNAPINEKQVLRAGEKETYKVKVYYDPEVTESELPTSNQSITVRFQVTYVQKDSTAIEVERFNVGDYISYHTLQESYTIPAGTTGYSSDQVIHPSELTLWRIIAKNSDGTIEAVSEYISSDMVTIGGIDGYTNYPQILQGIAEQYRDAGYAQSVRIFGYDGQTSTITNTTPYNGIEVSPPSTTSTPRPTTGSGEEFQGGVLGDTLYLRDYQLVSNAYKNDSRYGNSGLVAYKVDTPNSPYYYWTASRQYFYNTSSARFDFGGTSIGPNGLVGGVAFRSYYYGWTTSNGAYCIRPIITLHPYVQLGTGSGTIDDPYELVVDHD